MRLARLLAQLRIKEKKDELPMVARGYIIAGLGQNALCSLHALGFHNGKDISHVTEVAPHNQ